MRIRLTSIFVADQARAASFYTDILGFVIKNDVPLGTDRWLTVVSPDDTDGTELLLEPNRHPAVVPFTTALVRDGIPAASFSVDDMDQEAARLKGFGVHFTQEATAMGPVATAVFDDTCGNLIQIAQRLESSKS